MVYSYGWDIGIRILAARSRSVVAALTRRRRLIHSRARSNPFLLSIAPPKKIISFFTVALDSIIHRYTKSGAGVALLR